jgi:hypothetical protein
MADKGDGNFSESKAISGMQLKAGHFDLDLV